MAAGGREESLFGTGREKAFDAFLQSAPGKRFPELWFEIPLLGKPWFDLHVLTAVEDLPKDQSLSQDRCARFMEPFCWFREQENVRQLALSWDLNNGEKPEAAIQLLLKSRDLKAVCGFLEAKAGGNAVPANEWYYFKAPGGFWA